MDWKAISPILISATVFAATISAIANVVVALLNNRRLKTIEKCNRNNELVQYRYTKLYSILEDIEKEHGFSNYPNDPGRTLQEGLEKRLRFVALYKLSRPLINRRLCESLDKCATKEDESYRDMTRAMMQHDNAIIRDIIPSWNDNVTNYLNV